MSEVTYREYFLGDIPCVAIWIVFIIGWLYLGSIIPLGSWEVFTPTFLLFSAIGFIVSMLILFVLPTISYKRELVDKKPSRQKGKHE